MYRKILWCYVFLLTSFDISPYSKLTAQGKSHGASVQDSITEGIAFQEWGADSMSVDSNEAGEGVEGVALWPPALHFGRSALAEPHTQLVTLTNMANTTLHLASVAGTTPDFHASFFDSKSVPPQGNTSFSVVYLGRREGLVTAHLYIHTSLGVHKYPVSAIGVASEYDVWPLVGLRVPHNASVEPELTLYNPTDKNIQVSEVYSSGGWLGLRLASGESRAPRDIWTIPPRERRALVRLRISPTHKQPLAAYVRIKANIPGGGLVVCVEARSAPPGEHTRPLHLRLRPRGSNDPEHSVFVEAANSAASGVRLDAALDAASCWRTAPAPPPPCAHAHVANGGADVHSGAHLTVLKSHLEPFEDFTRVAKLTFNYAELWALSRQKVDEQSNGESKEGVAWCGGCVRLGKASVPYSLTLLPGTLAFQPDTLDIITSDEKTAFKEREVFAHNQFEAPIRITAVHLPDEVLPFFEVKGNTPLVLNPGDLGSLLTLRLHTLPDTIDTRITVHTNLSQYHIPLRLYNGNFSFEWDWPNSDGNLDLGVVGTSTTWRVGLRLRNRACVELCVTGLSATLPGASATLTNAAPQCVPPYGWSKAWLRVVAPAREGVVVGSIRAQTAYAFTHATLTLRAHSGRLAAISPVLPAAAPYAGAVAPLVVDSTMSLWMRVTGVSYVDTHTQDALKFVPLDSTEVGPGRHTVGHIHYEPEKLCEPNCYTGLPLDSSAGLLWLERSKGNNWADTIRADIHALQTRLEQFGNSLTHTNYSIYLHTTQVIQTPVDVMIEHTWPRLIVSSGVVDPNATSSLKNGESGVNGASEAKELGGVGLVPVGGRGLVWLRVRNPSSKPILVQPALAPTITDGLPKEAGGESSWCKSTSCVWSDSFSIEEWRGVKGEARSWEGDVVWLEPRAEVDVRVNFTPKQAASLTTYLYLRNNLTILEGVQLNGVGAVPSFDLGGRRPGPSSIFHFEVEECVSSTRSAVVRRRIVARNTGRVSIHLHGWDISRQGCRGRGFRVYPCAPLTLAPNQTAPIHLAFTPDYTLSRQSAKLRLLSDLGPVEYTLLATVPVKLLTRCAPTFPKHPWDAPIRNFVNTLTFIILAVLLFTAVYDSERLLRRARSTRAPSIRPPLDLREIAATTTVTQPPPPRAPPSRRKRPTRRTDPRAERIAFERWRTEVLRRTDDDSSRSSEDLEEKEKKEEVVEKEPEKPEEIEASSASDESTQVDEQDNDEAYTADAELDARDSPEETIVEPKISPIRTQSPPKVQVARRSPNNRRERRNDETVRKNTRPHVRKEKRRAQRAATPPRSVAVKENVEPGEIGESRGNVRWGASWSSVVAGPPLAPIGSDVRRRENNTDNSLFYYNGAPEPPRPEPEFAWRPAIGTPERLPFTPSTSARDFLDETPTFNNIGSVWGANNAWCWGGAPMRPPPGFAQQAPRPYDPFRSLASIWAPAPHDWHINPPNDDEQNN
ncbi:transmembrane protein 131 [Pieris brassicae]|uniref:transmembrane protein 131 n=1 Tax=Pieris brassicae TaxID=7116 RepID=UPI001E65E531|nr:transmembrane protein 131 [Pieris brassicae]